MVGLMVQPISRFIIGLMIEIVVGLTVKLDVEFIKMVLERLLN